MMIWASLGVAFHAESESGLRISVWIQVCMVYTLFRVGRCMAHAKQSINHENQKKYIQTLILSPDLDAA